MTEVSIKLDSGIATLSFRGGKGNSLPANVLKELSSSINSLATNSQAKVIILQSEGESAFCAGANFDELCAVTNEEQGTEFMSGFARVIIAMKSCPKLIVTRVQGKAVGGGVGLISASDYVIASKDAALKLSELALGIGPFVIGPAVEKKIGPANFSKMAIDVDWHSAEWAYSVGLYSKICASVKELDEMTHELALKLAGFSAHAMEELKTVLWQGTENWQNLLFERAKISGKLLVTEESKKIVMGLKGKG